MSWWIVGATGVVLAGWPGGVVAMAGWYVIGVRRSRSASPRSPDLVSVATRLLVLVGAGTPLPAALETAAAGSGIETEVDRTLRRARRVGTAAALASARGAAAPLLGRMGVAVMSGAPVEPAVRSFIDAERRRRHTAAVERARRLPVRMMVPMALLVLPGFVLMVYGPTLIGLVTDLVGPLTGG